MLKLSSGMAGVAGNEITGGTFTINKQIDTQHGHDKNHVF